MKAPSVHGGGAILESMSDKGGALSIGEAARGIAMLDGRDVSMVAISQSSRTDDGGEISLGDGFKRTGEISGDLDIPIMSPRTINEQLGLL